MGRSPLADDTEVLQAVARHPDPVVTAKDLVSLLPYSTARSVNNRLEDVVSKGLLRRKDVGAQAVVYWLSEDGQALVKESLSPSDGNQ